MEIYLDNWVWYLPRDVAAHAAQLSESMGPARPGVRRRVLIKAGGDGGGVWGQWDPGTLKPYLDSGLEVVPWHYVHPFNDAEVPAIRRTLAKFPAREVVLNPEVQWSYAGGVTDDYVKRWCTTGLETLLKDVPGIELGFSSVPSWTWFPYSAFSQACTGTEQPQCYFHQWVADQAGPSRLKSRVGARVVVGLPACQREDAGGQGETWDDMKLMDLADYYAMGMRDLVGFNGWQSGATGPGGIARPDFGWRAMAYAYGLLPEFQAPTTITPSGLDLPYNIRPEGDVWHCYLPDGSLDTWVVQPEFLKYYQDLGPRGLELLGLPISGMAPDEGGTLTQYFERGRMELQGGRVLLGRIGAEVLDLRNRARRIEVIGHGTVAARLQEVA